MDVVRQRKLELLARVSSELSSDPGALFDALDTRQLAFAAAVDALRPRVPAPLLDQYTKWFDRFQHLYVRFCKKSTWSHESLQSQLNDVSTEGLPPKLTEDSSVVRDLYYQTSILAVYDECLRCIDPENFAEVRAPLS